MELIKRLQNTFKCTALSMPLAFNLDGSLASHPSNLTKSLPPYCFAASWWVYIFISAMRHLRMSRHLYDIYKLSDSIYADIAIKDGALYDRIIAHRQHFIRQSGIDYKNHGKQNISFIPPSHILGQYKNDYEKMNLNMIYGPAPTFEVLIDKLSSLQKAIQKSTHSS